MIKIGVIMDAIDRIHYKKDSTLPLLWEATRRGMQLHYFEQQDLYLRNGVPYGLGCPLAVFENEQKWYELGEKISLPLADLSIILMRKDPPFDAAYLHTTYLLDHAERLGVLVANKPQALRDANEKLFATLFSEFCPPHLVTSSIALLQNFWREQGEIVCKPLDAMGGTSIFRLSKEEKNANVIFDTLTHHGTTCIMAQRFIPAITAGDKRIILINGEAIPYALARVPQGNEWRGNLAVGAKGVVQPLSARDQQIADAVGPVLRELGLYFVGMDVIGDYLTEINVTSPTGIREIAAFTGIDIAGKVIDVIEKI